MKSVICYLKISCNLPSIISIKYHNFLLFVGFVGRVNLWIYVYLFVYMCVRYYMCDSISMYLCVYVYVYINSFTAFQNLFCLFVCVKDTYTIMLELPYKCTIISISGLMQKQGNLFTLDVSSWASKVYNYIYLITSLYILSYRPKRILFKQIDNLWYDLHRLSNCSLWTL